MSVLSSKWVTCPREFALLREEWNALLAKSRSDVLFLTWEWQYSWWQNLGAGRSLAIAVARRDGVLIGLAPLLVRDRVHSRLIPYRVLEFIGSGSVGSDYLDLIIHRDEENEALNLIAGLIHERDLTLEGAGVLAQSSLASGLAGRLNNSGWRDCKTLMTQCPRANLEGHTWSSYMAARGASRVAEYRRKSRRLARAGRVTFEQVINEDQRRGALKILLELHLKRWESRGGSSALHTTGLQAFHECFSAIALTRGWLRLSLLRIDGRPAAAVYGFCYGSTFWYYQAGFDPELSQFSPGYLMVGMTMERAVDEGVLHYDFLRGQEPYKSFWADDERELLRIDLFPGHLQGRLCAWAMSARHSVKELARNRTPGPIRSKLFPNHA